MKKRSGVMLIEVLLALAIGSIVLTGGVVALKTITGAGQALHRQQMRVEKHRNEQRFLRTLGRLATGVGAEVGTDSTFHFKSFCDVPEGWRTACTVQIRRAVLSHTPETASFYVITSAHDSIQIGEGPGELRFLVSAAEGGKWQTQWHDVDRLPLGIEIVSARDSTFVRFEDAYSAAR